jgi:NTE family protein
VKPEDLMARRTRVALAIGCGGTLGFAWTAVALRELERALDWDARSADVLVGTSAGSELVAALGSGRTPQDILDALDGVNGAEGVLAAHVSKHPGHVPPRPSLGFPGRGLISSGLRNGSAYTALAGLLPRGRGDATWLREFGAALSGHVAWVPHPNTWIVASDAATGERVAFGRADAPVADLGSAIAASWAIPGWFPPVEIAGRYYVDGGSTSSVSADLLVNASVDEVVVVAPMTTHGGVPAQGLSRMERLLRRQMTRGLDREVATLRASGIRVIRVEPGAEELAAMGPNFMNLSRRPATLEAARRVIADRVAEAVRASDRTEATA